MSQLDIIEFTETAPASAGLLRAPGVGRQDLVFGTTTVRVGPSVGVDADRPGLRRKKLAPGSKPYVIVQKGDLFQREWPDVEILLDHGRFLLVSVPDDHPLFRTEHREPCYALRPAAGGDVVYQRLAQREAVEAPSPSLTRTLAFLSAGTFSATLEALARIHTRLSATAGYDQAVAECGRRLEAFGYHVSERPITVDGGRCSNLVARWGRSPGTPVVLVTAHLDSINHEGGPTAPAPGADDNASGSAGLIAIAEALATAGAANDVLLVLFGGEEQGLIGSEDFVAAQADFDRARVSAVINMDMIGSINKTAEVSRLATLIEGAEVSRSVVEGLAAAANRYTELDVSVSFHPHNSDHETFIRAGLPAVLTIEGEDSKNSFVHTGEDKIHRIDVALAMHILTMNLAFIIETVRPDVSGA